MAIITVSRPYGSGGTLFASLLVEKTGYLYIDKSFCSVMGEEVKQCLMHFESEEEETAPFLVQRIGELMTNRNFYKVNLMATIYSMALKGNVIFVGRGANIILHDIPGVLSLQITGALADRVRAIAGLKDLSYDDALKLIEKADTEKRKFIEYYFDKNIFDPTIYHFVINLSRVPLLNAVETVTGYVDKFITEAERLSAQKILRNRLIEKKGEILLFGLGMAQNAKLNFEAKDDGTLTVKGIVSGEGEKKKLFKALETIDGVERIEDNIKTGILSRMIY